MMKILFFLVIDDLKGYFKYSKEKKMKIYYKRSEEKKNL